MDRKMIHLIQWEEIRVVDAMEAAFIRWLDQRRLLRGGITWLCVCVFNHWNERRKTVQGNKGRRKSKMLLARWEFSPEKLHFPASIWTTWPELNIQVGLARPIILIVYIASLPALAPGQMHQFSNNSSSHSISSLFFTAHMYQSLFNH